MKTIKFNTGRKYTAEGQVIIATLHDDDRVTFMDHSRGIAGEFSHGADWGLTQLDVMSAYDINAYKSSSRAWSDGMQRGGCNTRDKAKL
jgi:hypothetical protein